MSISGASAIERTANIYIHAPQQSGRAQAQHRSSLSLPGKGYQGNGIAEISDRFFLSRAAIVLGGLFFFGV